MTAPAMRDPACPKCSGPLWDNRTTKRNPKAPDWKCKDRACDGVIWGPRQTGPQRVQATHDQQIGPEYGNLPGVPMETAVPSPETGNERLQRIFKVQEVAFTHALKLAAIAEAKGVSITLEGLSALTAQCVIQFHQRDGR